LRLSTRPGLAAPCFQSWLTTWPTVRLKNGRNPRKTEEKRLSPLALLKSFANPWVWIFIAGG
ncbi:TPA: hypothetical protein ACOEOA_004633, partial [Stenotrophomonas maltophilia]